MQNRYDIDFFNEPLTIAFQDSGLIFFHKYNSILTPSNFLNFYFMAIVNDLQESKC